MSLFGKLFGGKSPEEERSRADALFAQGEFGSAKQAYERAQKAFARDADEPRRELQKRIDECCDSIASARIEEAERCIEDGNVVLAIEELHSAAQTAVSAQLVHDANARIERLERKTVREQVQHAELAPEDRFEILSGGFEEDQHAEYLAHGPRVREALSLLHDGKTTEARVILEDVVQTADGPRYLHFELGRARLAEGLTDTGVQSLETFLSKLGESEGGDARLLAHMELATAVHARGDFDGAVEQYEAALDALPNDPRPYLALAAFLRRAGAPDEAIEVVEAGLAALATERPEWRLWQELGLSHADAGRDANAIEWLERVLDYLVAKQRVEPSPEATVRLAQLYEKKGNAGRALDLYSLLASGSDLPNLCSYHMESARLMRDLGMPDEARRMLSRATELAEGDEALRERIAKAVADLDTPA